MSQPPTGSIYGAPGGNDPRVAPVKKAVKVLAGFVILSLAAALFLAAVNIITDRPAKELFLGPGPDPDLVESPFQRPPPGPAGDPGRPTDAPPMR